jgi:hypothetical protein
MAGLVPAIHVFDLVRAQGVDARHKAIAVRLRENGCKAGAPRNLATVMAALVAAIHAFLAAKGRGWPEQVRP